MKAPVSANTHWTGGASRQAAPPNQRDNTQHLLTPEEKPVNIQG